MEHRGAGGRGNGSSTKESQMSTNQRDGEVDRYQVCRLTVPVPSYLDFQKRYEEAVPEMPLAAIQELVARNAPWSEMLSLIEGAAPHDFLIYRRENAGLVMKLAGDLAECVAYLMGNHTIAERMFRYDARVMLYAPLHTVIWEDHDGNAWFTADQPSTQIGSFGIPEVAAVGRELDEKLARLLEALDVEVPAPLLSS
jgi:hypothetical protein